jgi:hypothetical protein
VAASEKSVKQPLYLSRRNSTLVLNFPFTSEVTEGTLSTRLSETAIAFELRFAKPLVRRWLLREKVVLDRVLPHVRRGVSDD